MIYGNRVQLRKVQLLKYVFFNYRPKFGNVAINANFFLV